MRCLLSCRSGAKYIFFKLFFYLDVFLFIYFVFGGMEEDSLYRMR